jgi:hypothetical protein
MNWVKPNGGWPATCVKNCDGVAGEQGVSAVSIVQVPACQPSAGSSAAR